MNIDLVALAQMVQRLAQFPAFGVDIQADHANLVISYGPGNYIVQVVTAAQMDDMCHRWQNRHEEE